MSKAVAKNLVGPVIKNPLPARDDPSHAHRPLQPSGMGYWREHDCEDRSADSLRHGQRICPSCKSPRHKGSGFLLNHNDSGEHVRPRAFWWTPVHQSGRSLKHTFLVWRGTPRRFDVRHVKLRPGRARSPFSIESFRQTGSLKNQPLNKPSANSRAGC